MNVSLLVPLLAEQTCRNLQRSFSGRRHYVMLTKDVTELTCAVLLVIFVVDILGTPCTR